MAVALALPPAVVADGLEERALAYLAREAPRWSAEHRCRSCHHDGDAARTLQTAIRLGYPVPGAATASVDAWLARPADWPNAAPAGPFADRVLAPIQFAATLEAAVASGRVVDPGRAASRVAADALVTLQAPDGSWPVEDGGRVGSPAAYGRPLATAVAVRPLRSIAAPAQQDAVRKAESWFRQLEPRDVVAASARRLAMGPDRSAGWEDRRRRDLDLLLRAQAPDGGWGPFVDAAPEPFDTALALLALHEERREPAIAARIDRGRSALIATQQDDGSWPETTRPAGAESLAQRVSTSAWATLALIATRARSQPGP